MLGPKNRFSQIWFLSRKIFLCKKNYQYSNSNSPLFGSIVEKTCWKIFTKILPCWQAKKSIFSKFGFLGPFCHFTQPLWPKNFAEPKNSQQDFCSLVLSLKQTNEQTIEFLPKLTYRIGILWTLKDIHFVLLDFC